MVHCEALGLNGAVPQGTNRPNVPAGVLEPQDERLSRPRWSSPHNWDPERRLGRRRRAPGLRREKHHAHARRLRGSRRCDILRPPRGRATWLSCARPTHFHRAAAAGLRRSRPRAREPWKSISQQRQLVGASERPGKRAELPDRVVFATMGRSRLGLAHHCRRSNPLAGNTYSGVAVFYSPRFGTTAGKDSKGRLTTDADG